MKYETRVLVALYLRYKYLFMARRFGQLAEAVVTGGCSFCTSMINSTAIFNKYWPKYNNNKGSKLHETMRCMCKIIS